MSGQVAAPILYKYKDIGINVIIDIGTDITFANYSGFPTGKSRGTEILRKLDRGDNTLKLGFTNGTGDVAQNFAAYSIKPTNSVTETFNISAYNKISFVAVGGGGGGGGGGNSNDRDNGEPGGGGGGGAMIVTENIDCANLANMNFNVGTKGNKGTNAGAAGNSGNATTVTIGSLVFSAGGGNGGGGGANDSPGTGGGGGNYNVGSGADVVVMKTTGNSGSTTSGSTLGAPGGYTQIVMVTGNMVTGNFTTTTLSTYSPSFRLDTTTGAGLQASNNVQGNDANSYGGGGSGAGGENQTQDSVGGRAGGDGYDGYLLVYFYVL